MADFLVAVGLVVVGLIVCLAGLRVFFVALPLVGFVAGFYIGAAGTASVLGERFLSSLTGVIVGLIVGAVLGVLAYFLWYVGALLSAGSTGALIGSAVMYGLGVTSGWAVAIVSATVGVLFFALAFKLALRVYVVVVNTAFLGAAAALGGLLVLFNQVDREDLGYGVAWAAIEESWFWLLAWVVLAAVGLGVQLQSLGSVTLPEERFAPAEPA